MGSAPLNIERQGRGLGRGRENRRGERTGRRRGGHRRWLRFLGLDGARDGRSRTLEPSSFCLYSMIVFTPFASGPITYASRTRRGTRRVSRARGRGGCWLSRGRTVGGGVRDDDRWWRGRAPAPPEARPRSLRRHRARRSPPNASCPPLWRTSQLAACAARVKEGGATPVVLASCDRIGAIKGLLNPEKRAAGPGGDDTSQEGSAESRTSIRVASVSSAIVVENCSPADTRERASQSARHATDGDPSGARDDVRGYQSRPPRVSCLEEARSIGARRFWAYRRGARRERRRPLRGAQGCVLGRGLAPRGQGCQEYEAPVHHGCASGGPRAGRRIRKRVPRRPELHGDVRRPHHILSKEPLRDGEAWIRKLLRHPKLNCRLAAVRIIEVRDVYARGEFGWGETRDIALESMDECHRTLLAEHLSRSVQ